MPLRIYFEDESQVINDPLEFFKEYQLITAAGGVVINDEQNILLIFRRGKWDLPKGKAEPGETMEVCAEREIKEETGLSGLTLQRFLLTTYHTYVEKGQPILKDTHWFLFHAHGNQAVQPQTEEDISKIEWADARNIENYTNNTYRLIIDVLEAAGITEMK